jgi:hypothetical protein
MSVFCDAHISCSTIYQSYLFSQVQWCIKTHKCSKYIANLLSCSTTQLALTSASLSLRSLTNSGTDLTSTALFLPSNGTLKKIKQ